MQRTAIGQIASLYGGRSVVLKADLRAPTATAEGMQAPMFDAKGWHFAAGSPVLRSGTLAEITGVFNYSERGFFLEVATADGSHGEALIDRPRVRVRVNIATPATDPSGQVAEAARLIEAIVAPVASAAP